MTSVRPLAASYVDIAATDTGTVADMTASMKTEKYSSLSSMYKCVPNAIDNLHVFNSSTSDFLVELGRRIYSQYGDVGSSY